MSHMNVKKPQIRLVIADGHPIFREVLRRLFEAEGQKVIGEASYGAEAVKLARQLKPDILLLLNLRFPNSGLDALRELSTPASATPVRVILLCEKSQIVEALQLGARGVVYISYETQLLLRAIQNRHGRMLREPVSNLEVYLRTSSETQVLFKAIQTVMAGEYWVLREPASNLEGSLRTLMQSTHEEERRREEQERQSLFGFTLRELEIMSSQVAAGYSDEEIAEYFKISEEELNNIFDKLGLSKHRMQLAFFADKFKK
jgi:DNA-binding NarL/FixJ family response regulator